MVEKKPPDPAKERVGVNAVEALILKEFGWFFREQPISDYGIDAHIEEMGEDGKPTGKLIALQIKSGPSYFDPKNDGYIFRGEPRHLEYWTNHSLPVFIILHNPESALTIWQKIDRKLVKEAEKSWSIFIPATNVLNASAKQYFEQESSATPEAARRFRMASDLEHIRRFMDEKEIYFELNEWVNKTINMREVGVYFGELDKEKFDFKFPYWAGHYTVFEFMSLAFPWLDYEHLETTEGLDGEVDVHSLLVSVNDLGKAYAAAEEFFENGLPERDEPEAPEISSDAFTEEEANEHAMQRAIERDPWK
jgi:hypothetical protein